MISVSDILKVLDKIPEWVGLKRLLGRVDALEKKVAELEAKLNSIGTKPAGEACPVCETGRLKVASARPDPLFGRLGVEERTLACTECSYTSKRQFDPNGMMKG